MKFAHVLLLCAALSALMFVGGCYDDPATHAESAEVWTCSMHPLIRLPKPGKCPVCKMDLILLGGDSTGPRQLAMSAEAMALAKVSTAAVARREVAVVTPLQGKLMPDESRLRTIAAWVGGRLDRVYVDTTGIPVQAGEHLALLYSPDLYSAQQAYLDALRLETPKGNGITSPTVASMRERLTLWGMSEAQIDAVRVFGKADTHVEISAPIGGIITQRDAIEGRYVQVGHHLYTIVDLSVLWLEMDAYERDLPHLHPYQELRFEVPAYPGEFFEARVAFIDPMLDSRTRTVRLRASVPNTDGRLKPGMLATARVESALYEGGPTLPSALAGKWICPMHPQVIRSGPGIDDEVCGMALLSIETFTGLSAASTPRRLPLAVPASAVLHAGNRAVVFVELPDRETPTFELREVLLGERAGDWYVVKAGVLEGERVVREGGFKIDSAMQIAGKQSLMSMAAEKKHDEHVSGASAHEDQVAGGWICPMRVEHPKVYDAPGDCPLCGMTLEPVNKEQAHEHR